MKKRILAFFLAIIMIVSSFNPTVIRKVSAASITNSVGDFYYASEEVLTKDYKATYYYSDSYFAHSSYQYDESLATMSMCVAMSSGRSNRTKDYAQKSQNLKALLTQCGFTNFEVNTPFKTKPTTDSTGVGCAKKTIYVNGASYTLISLTVSSGRYGAEWGGSFALGKSGDMENARIGADDALKFLKQYISSQGIRGNIKLWITGFELGAGKANLLAADIDNGVSLGNVALKKENMYAYCFQSPQTTPKRSGAHDDVYENIFVINNPYNVMTILPPTEYGFDVYGVVKKYETEHGSSQYRRKRNAMLEQLEQLDGNYDYIIDDFKMKKIDLISGILSDDIVQDDTSKDWDQAQFVQEFSSTMIDCCADTRAQYVDDFQDVLCELLEIIFGTNDDNWMTCMNIFVKNMRDDLFNVGWTMYFKNKSDLIKLYTKYANDAVSKSGVVAVTDKDIALFADVLSDLTIAFGKKYPDLTITLFDNVDSIFQAMYAPVNLAWLRSEDPNYNGTGRDITKCNASLSGTSFTYTGGTITPTVKVVNGGIILTQGTDYDVRYSNNVNAGTGTATVIGKGLYSGQIPLTFKINKANNSIQATNFTKTYATKNVRFRLNAKTNGGAGLTYQSNNSKIVVSPSGIVTVKAKYIGRAVITIVSAPTVNYNSAVRRISVTVNPTKTSLVSVNSSKSKSISVKWKKNTTATGYQICFSTSKNFKKDTVSVKIKGQKTTKKTFKGFRGNKTYYVKIRAYKTVNKKTYYGGWSSIKSKRTKR